MLWVMATVTVAVAVMLCRNSGCMRFLTTWEEAAQIILPPQLYKYIAVFRTSVRVTTTIHCKRWWNFAKLRCQFPTCFQNPISDHWLCHWIKIFLRTCSYMHSLKVPSNTSSYSRDAIEEVFILLWRVPHSDNDDLFSILFLFQFLFLMRNLSPAHWVCSSVGDGYCHIVAMACWSPKTASLITRLLA